MPDTDLRAITILGGGAAGWMAAAMLASVLDLTRYTITVVESEEIDIIGVGEASVPILRRFNDMIGMDEHAFLRQTLGTYKLGIEFCDWGEPGNRYFHGFGDYGDPINGVPLIQYWLRLHQAGNATDFNDFSFPYAMARRGKFTPGDTASLSHLHAYHFDARLYAGCLRAVAEKKGVRRVEGRMVSTRRDAESGDILALQLADGREVAGDLFLDCTGFAGALIGKELQTPYVDWSHWLPTDSAMAVPSEANAAPTPFTRSTAKAAGWQWRIPLQHRVGNGLVYCSGHMGDDAALDALMAGIDGAPLAEPRRFRFTSGRRTLMWNHNCVAIGFAAGFLEPLESTGIQLIQTAIGWLIEYFPHHGINPVARGEYNRIATTEIERIRDFIIAHYCINQRSEPFWAQCRTMELPDSLKYKLEVWKACARVPLMDAESYQLPSWIAILLGNGLVPDTYDGRADALPIDTVRHGMASISAGLARAAQSLPDHAAYLDRHCKARECV